MNREAHDVDQAARTPLAKSRWLALLEGLLFLFPPLVGVGLIGVLQERAIPLVSELLVWFSAVGYLVLTVGIPICIYGDVRWLRHRPDRQGRHDKRQRRNRRDQPNQHDQHDQPNQRGQSQRRQSRRWRPTAWQYMLPAILWPPIVGVVYLAVRHNRQPSTATASGWWFAVAVGFGAYAFGLLLSLVGVSFGFPRVLIAGIALAGTIAYGVFPAAIYRDACYAQSTGGRWQPNPGVYLGLAFVSLFVALLQPVVAGYYLVRRSRTRNPTA